jgi:SagB-type dehydrogenase family enzyme
MKIRVDPAIHVHFDLAPAESTPQIVIDQLRWNTRFELLSTAALRALDLACEWVDVDEYIHALYLQGLGPEQARNFLNDALDNGLLQTNPAKGEEESRAQLLNCMGASLSHQLLIAKSSQIYLDYSSPEANEAEECLMQEYSSEQSPPDIFKDCEQPLRTVLLSADREQPAAAIEFRPASSRATPIDSTWLASFLLAAFGATAMMDDPIQGKLLLKTYPSGGSRHPLECYIAALSVDGLEPGVYHYSVRRHALDLLTGNEQAICDALSLDFSPRLIVMLTTVPERVMWRYREQTSIWVAMLDVGHAIGNFALICNSERISYRIHTGGNLQRLGGLLPLPPFRELPAVAMAIGASPVPV